MKTKSIKKRRKHYHTAAWLLMIVMAFGFTAMAGCSGKTEKAGTASGEKAGNIIDFPGAANVRTTLSREGYTLTEAVVLSRHSIRSPLSGVGSALEAEEYELPDAIEKKTPIGSKLVVSKWVNGSGDEFISLDLVYQKTEQLRGISLLSKDDPPGIYTISLKGLTAEKDGLYRSSDVLSRFTKAIDAYNGLSKTYAVKQAA